MLITVNGREESIEREMSVAELLDLRKLEPIRVAVELNEDLVPRGRLSETLLHHGDRLEIVTFVGGG